MCPAMEGHIPGDLYLVHDVTPQNTTITFELLAFHWIVTFCGYRLEVPNSQVKAVYLAARHLKMDRVVKECTRHLIKNLNVENCIETRSLPGIARNKAFVEQVDTFIAKEVCNCGQYYKAATLDCVDMEVSVWYCWHSYRMGVGW